MNIADLFGKVQDMQKKMEEAKQSLNEVIVTAEVGGGMVSVTANGNKHIVKIRIDKDAMDPNDIEMLEDLLIAGVNKALDSADEAAKEKMADITRGMMPGGGIPGMDLSKFGL